MKDFTRGKISAYFNYSLVQKLAGKTRQDREVILSKFVGDDMERSTFIKHYDSLASSSEWNRSKLASFWLRKKDRSIEDMTVVLPLVADKYSKSDIVSTWLAKPESNREDLVAVLQLFADKYSKLNIASKWLAKPERTREDFVAVLSVVTDERNKYPISPQTG